MKRMYLTVVLAILLGLLAPVYPAAAKPRPVQRIQIPSIGVDLAITVAPYRNGTWNFNRIVRQAAFLAGRPLPGQNGNAVIAAHSELARRRPGPFFRLSELQPGDQVIVLHDGTRYVYQVDSSWSVDPTDISPLIQTDTDVLTLITCDGYNVKTRHYDKRLIVRASRVS